MPDYTIALSEQIKVIAALRIPTTAPTPRPVSCIPAWWKRAVGPSPAWGEISTRGSASSHRPVTNGCGHPLLSEATLHSGQRWAWAGPWGILRKPDRPGMAVGVSAGPASCRCCRRTTAPRLSCATKNLLNLHVLPEHLGPHLVLAKTHLQGGARTEAKAVLKKALSLAPGDITLTSMLAETR